MDNTFIFMLEKEMYGCVCCNRKERVFCLYDYYDTKKAPYCGKCFIAEMRKLLHRVKSYDFNSEETDDRL
jgi:hypothetical protein